MAWFNRQQPGVEGSADGEKRVRTEGLWLKCEQCSQIIWKKALDENLQVCPQCEFHFRLDARARLAMLFDDGVYEERDADMVSTDPLRFVDSKPYSDRLAAMQAATELSDALISGAGKLEGRDVNICAMELKFIGGSMGSVVGEKITRAIEDSIERRIPVIIVSASGGARMQEGAVSLMQLAKISSALMRLDEARVPYISVLTDPTTGGVTASFAMLGDLNIAEPGAQIGFAGPRVIEQTIRQKLPAGFQTSEFLLQHGFLDAVVKRAELKDYIGKALDFFLTPAAIIPAS
jgi:acetyl-CoA carboxylase carboxyl transferase subunit beta